MTRPPSDPESVDSPFERAVAGPVRLGLAELDRTGRFLDRRDRKYIVDTAAADDLLRWFSDRVAVLEIDGRRSFRYDTTYFDTPDLALFEAAARGRRRRFKIRKRHYVDTAVATCEVKATEGFGRTVKYRRPIAATELDTFDPSDRAFVEEVLGGWTVPPRLDPTLTTSYLRTTALGRDAEFRLTIDRHLRCSDVSGPCVRLDGHAIVEVKSTTSRTEVDRWLWQHGSRPVRFSKYATALAATRGLAHHRWHRQLRLLVPTDG